MADLSSSSPCVPIFPLLPFGDWKGEEDILYVPWNVLEYMWNVLILRHLLKALTKFGSFYYVWKCQRIVFTDCSWNSSLFENTSKRCLWCAPSVSSGWCIWYGMMWGQQRFRDGAQEIPSVSWWNARSMRDIDVCTGGLNDYVSEAGVRGHGCMSSLNIFRWMFYQVVPKEVRK